MIWSKSPPIAAFALALVLAMPAAGRMSEVLEPVMAGEFALQAGDFAQAAGHYLRAAEGSRDPGLAERAARIALLAGQPEMAATAISRWRELSPGSLSAAAASIQLALDLGDADAAFTEAVALMDPARTTGFPVLLSALGDARDTRASVARKVLRNLYETDHMPATLGGWLAVAGLARRLVAEGSLELTLYGVRHAEAGGLEHAPLRPVAVLAHDSLRIEPYDSGLPIAER